MTDLEKLAKFAMPFAEHIGVQFVSASKDCVTARLLVTPQLCTLPAILHGGAVMAFADSLGAAATLLNLPDGMWTTTIESKTNFIGPAPVGTTVTGETTPVHRGRRTMVWQTKVTAEGGKPVALVTQTQLVFEK